MLPYQDHSLTIHQRVSDLLARMTVQEKIGQLNQHLYGWKVYTHHGSHYELTEDFKQHVAWGQGLGALYGLFRADPWSGRDQHNGIPLTDSPAVADLVQDFVLQHSRLHIPTLLVEEAPHGHQALGSVSYPTNIGKGNSFDPALISECASCQAQEMVAKGVNLALVSTLDLLKDPRWGRSEETFGESPTLAAAYTEAIIQGYQGSLITDDDFQSSPADGRKHIGVVIKHLIGQGDVLGGHNAGTVPLGERELRDIYSPLLHSVRHAVGVMAAYNDLDGVPCHANHRLLTDWLRTTEKFQGIVMADGTALDRLVDLYETVSAAASAALHAGVDLSLWDDVYTHLDSALQQNPAILADLDQAVARILGIKFLLGLFDEPATLTTRNEWPAIINASRNANRKMAQESMTLIKNNHLLPLKANQMIGLFGPQTNNIYDWLGDYTAPQDTEQYTTIQAAIRPYAKKLLHSVGSQLRVPVPDKDFIWLDRVAEQASSTDVNILILGGSSARSFDMAFMANGALSSTQGNTDTGENVDLSSLSLPQVQLDLLQTVKNTGKPLVVLMVQGRPYDLQPVLAAADAVLLAWYPGQEGPQAAADILFGRCSPTGRLNISYPRNSGQLPVYYYQRRAAKNDDYLDEPGSPLLPFGFGLDYTTWQYDKLTVQHSATMHRSQVDITIYNEGGRNSTCPILVFAQLAGTTVLPREKQLITFSRIFVPAGQKRTLHWTILDSAFSYYNEAMKWSFAKSAKITVGNQHALLILE